MGLSVAQKSVRMGNVILLGVGVKYAPPLPPPVVIRTSEGANSLQMSCHQLSSIPCFNITFGVGRASLKNVLFKQWFGFPRRVV
jgi:hypothetical protein